jgi:hypothetical protein
MRQEPVPGIVRVFTGAYVSHESCVGVMCADVSETDRGHRMVINQ